MGGGRRLALTLGFTLFTAPALAAGILPITGAYGNDQGCALYSAGTIPSGQGEFFLITPNSFSSYPVVCSFISAAPSGTLGILVSANCRTADGQADRETMHVIPHTDTNSYGFKPDGGPEYGPWPACPPKQPGVPDEVQLN